MSNELRRTATITLIIGVVVALIVIAGYVVATDDGNAEEMIYGFGIAGVVLFIAFLIHDLLKGFAELIDNTAQQAQYSREILAELCKGKEKLPDVKKFPCENRESKATDSACDDEKIACPACGMIQRKNRSVCWK